MRTVGSWRYARSAGASPAPRTGSKNTSKRRWWRSHWKSRRSGRYAWPMNSPSGGYSFPPPECGASGCGTTWRAFANGSRRWKRSLPKSTWFSPRISCALERAREEKEAQGEIETAHPGYLGTQDTYYVGTIKSVGRIYQQTFLDTYTKVAFSKLYDRKNALVAADLLNDRVLPFFEEQGIPLLRVLTDRGTEYCGQREHHEYELYLAVENIDHSRTRARRPQSNGICERFHRTLQEEFYAAAFRRKL